MEHPPLSPLADDLAPVGTVPVRPNKRSSVITLPRQALEITGWERGDRVVLAGHPSIESVVITQYTGPPLDRRVFGIWCDERETFLWAVRIVRNGNALAVTIPEELAREVGWENDDSVLITAASDRIVAGYVGDDHEQNKLA